MNKKAFFLEPSLEVRGLAVCRSGQSISNGIPANIDLKCQRRIHSPAGKVGEICGALLILPDGFSYLRGLFLFWQGRIGNNLPKAFPSVKAERGGLQNGGACRVSYSLGRASLRQ